MNQRITGCGNYIRESYCPLCTETNIRNQHKKLLSSHALTWKSLPALLWNHPASVTVMTSLLSMALMETACS